ncbi:hypothetical protein CO115_01460 [Candidatus Falkowbacteria bacterium CG_4_9_14_3_um_filter_36_9]|nr:MAG: hypothetical protein CO115_01460 [Candidatus Falkowbacteria bacterium CG_4_9_14_3_um_filter_36_9]
MDNIDWQHRQDIGSHSYQCSHCGKPLASDKGYMGVRQTPFGNKTEYICVCHFCHKPTYIDMDGKQYPGVAFGNSIDGIDNASVKSLYEEARSCASVNAFTAGVMACRKILMNIAVSKGAKENLKFVQYVKFLSDNYFVPPDGKEWVEHIKNKGNDANHKIEIVSKEDGEELLYFTEMLLTLIYAVPARFKKAAKGKDEVSESKTQNK